jgi:glycosyltransferase involved in cell wall biosynthesis
MSTPIFSVVIPARNEERELPRCLSAINSAWEFFKKQRDIETKVPHEFCDQENFVLEVIVVLNRCTDTTEDIARKAGCTIVHNDEKNLASIRNTGVRASHSPFVITVDADSRMSENTFYNVHTLLASNAYVGGGVLILPERWSLGIFCTGLMLLPIALWYRISAGLFFFRRDAFDAIGGFNELLPSVEDIAFAKALKRHGRTINQKYANLLFTHIITSTRKFDRLGDWYFVLHPIMTFNLLKASDADAANRIWYDFPRD